MLDWLDDVGTVRVGTEHLFVLCTGVAELGDSSSESGRDKTKKKRCTLCKKRVGLTGW